MEFERGVCRWLGLLLIMGLGGQLIHWDEEFCRQLADQGYLVIRFDNRDVGLSTKFDEAGPADMAQLFESLAQGKPIETPYSLEDMSDDVAGLLDGLDIPKAHICGSSMGGMIAQSLAIRHPDRLSSLVTIYSTTGNPELPPPHPEGMAALMTPPPAERQPAYSRHLRTRVSRPQL